MKPSFSIGDEVEVIGQPYGLSEKPTGKTARITEIESDFSGMMGCRADGWWYPASSLRLVDEELKIGDYVVVIKPGIAATGKAGKIIRIDEDEAPIQLEDKSWWRVASLRKLTQEEIQQHTGTIGYKMRECQKDAEKAANALREILAPLVDERLSAIEKRLDAQKDAIIEMELILKVQDEEIKVLEGERPEVCQQPLSHIGSLAAMASFGPVPGCVAAFIRHEPEEAEKLKLKGTCDEEDCRPFPDNINVSIWVGEEAHTNESCCPNELIDWCEKVLNAMRNGGA
jgi:hypothetical protein